MHPPSNPHHHSFPNPHFLHRPPPPLPQPAPPQQSVPPPPDLDTALATLKNLITLSTQTLTSLSQNYQITIPQNDNLTPCPFNNHHRMPPESLFSHSLRCPTPLPIDRPGTEDEDFAYRDCPAVVKFPQSDNSGSWGLTMPGVLADQCGRMGIEGVRIRMLPSEVWELRNEVAGWREFPGRCSVSVVRAVLGGRFVSAVEFKRWVILNSTGFGVVIDGYVRDCVGVLFRLCFKAIAREAGELIRDWEESGRLLLECHVWVEVLSWLAARLSVLYGEVNGKLFAVNMLKHVLLESASGMMLFDGEKDGNEFGGAVDVKAREPSKTTSINCGENFWGGEIFVDQVDAAIDALYKRSLLEENIRLLRAPRPLTRYERNAEHTYLTIKAEEERRSRTNFRKIIDHDGLPRHYSSNQDMNKRKTIEELLAEERDYKRRRMSYRGKKVKRSALQVMRDIIEEYMDEIKQAGGIGCFEKGIVEEGSSQPAEPREDVCIQGNPCRYKEELHQGYDAIHKEYENDAFKDYDRQRQRSHSRSENWEGQSKNFRKDRSDKVHHYRSPDRSRSHGKSYSHSNHRMELEDVNEYRKHHDKAKTLSPRRSKYQDKKSLVSRSVGKSEKKLETVDGKLRDQRSNHHSNYIVQDAYPDRYDPSESHDMQEDYVYTGRLY